MIRFSKKGFSLLGVIFAIGIITIGLISILGLINYIILVGRLSQDRFVASNLAQEGIEIVRGIRDTNWISGGANWKNGLADGEYEVQYNETSLSALWVGSGRKLKIDTNGFYNYSSGIDSKFTRKVEIKWDEDSGATNDNIDVISTVTWDMPGFSGTSVIVQDRLYNWW
ncbi:MAG: hypothetical protein A2174_00380 [Candidatus Portnoybacteria bacterium RBG_13_41_18]|uniref:Type 4 fimbrial biogenesis protein PilX N-terminal domain-containing protein n=1 Tax=Candidatus Portnoybacteria bacterium RBG_13_41_18 TaxID=1801991 RepID=A0A1G2F626_9BACT|nr:MAG: hypothetical protein A2174_00380 [Candidatus Portnoybacteria bacterium RBG_13_41_18]